MDDICFQNRLYSATETEIILMKLLAVFMLETFKLSRHF